VFLGLKIGAEFTKYVKRGATVDKGKGKCYNIRKIETYMR
jgi:hypothetical protein